jgi:phospholipase C
MRMPKGSAASLLAVCVLAGGSTAAASTASASAGERTVAAGPTAANTTPIKHVIEIMMENHAFDNLFGDFPGADGIPAGTRLPNPEAYVTSEPTVSPVWATPNEGDVQGAIDNSRAGEQMAMDYQPGLGYQMDNYTRYPYDGMSAITEFGPSFDPNLQYAAKNYELADQNFQAAIGPSNPNIHYALTGTANGWMYNNLQPGTSNATWPSIFKELDAAGLTAKLYYGLPPSELGPYWDELLPLDRQSDATTDAQFYRDLASENLPDFSLVRSDDGYYSEEPPEDITEGDAWVGQVLKAIADSPEWDSTAVFITYDEGGGFWDHVAPPVKTAYGYGTRTPMVIVSPYARTGIFSEQTTNMSILSFVQHLWGLAPLTALNAGQNDLMAAFNFHQAPLAPPRVPQAPTDTIAFYDSTYAPATGSTLTVNLRANTDALLKDPDAAGTVSLTVIPPSGGSVPSGFPSTVTMTDGKVSFKTSFKAAGYYRIEATGPHDGEGWTTVDVGVNPNTLP